ncbi:MAG: glycosyltransferase family 1 protein [Actinobacteria bacterium]|nr:MAG: glycosyltransferase family 1 protein [Actinomycetota bacterium]
MKITIDASGALGNRTGVGNYIYNLVNNLCDIGQENQYQLYFNYVRPKENPFIGFNQVKNRFPVKFSRYLNKFFPIEICTGKVDIFHGPNYFVPQKTKAKRVVTIHDLGFILYPDAMLGNDASYYLKKVPKLIEESDHVITISKSTKKDLIEQLGVAKEKISVTHMAAGEDFKPIDDKRRLKTTLNKYQLPDKYLLAVATLEPRKNISTLVKALSVLKKSKKLTQKLVVVGGSGWKSDSLSKEIKEYGLEDEIIFPGFIGQEDLPFIYNACSLFLFPSIYEGFGIPLLEALSCGKPCISSNTSSMPEVAGDAAILIDPLDANSWADNIVDLLENPAKEEDLSKKALIQTQKFSWQKTAKQTLLVYKQLSS